jgi:GDP-L-fucose synthase
MVGSSVVRTFSKDTNHKVFSSTRKDTDLFSLTATRKLIDEVSPDLVVNAAARVGGILANNTQRTEFILENLKINMNIFESCIHNPEIKIINLGSSCIYPLNSKNPINEDSFMEGKLEPTNSPYAIAKIGAIEIGRSMNQQYGHKVVNLMPTNLYGPYDNFSKRDSHVIPGLIARMYDAKLNNDKYFKIWGTGKPLREFLYVEDLADAIHFFTEIEWTSDLYNIGSGEEISIYDLSRKIKDLINFKGDLIFDDSKPDGNPRKLLNSKKVNSLGWSSKTSLDEGLTNTIKWFEGNAIK